jgi:hypothetical protein
MVSGTFLFRAGRPDDLGKKVAQNVAQTIFSQTSHLTAFCGKKTAQQIELL